MPKPLDLPDDLRDLGRAAYDAERALEAAARGGGDVDAARVGGCHAQTLQALRDGAREAVAAG